MKIFINLTEYILILLVFYGCNGDVFVDDFRSADSELTLDGNGDTKIIRFASSNWDVLGASRCSFIWVNFSSSRLAVS